MGLKEGLVAAVKETFALRWTRRDGIVVPSDDSIGLGNDGVDLSGTVLYADLADSTALVDGYRDEFAAETYKAFLHCAAKIIRSESADITAYDGDRVMAMYIGDLKNTRAIRTAMKINYAVREIIRPLQRAQYPNSQYTVKQVVGIDTSKLLVARTGVRGANDLVWVGRAANHAAKLSSEPDDYQIYVTKEVYDGASDPARVTEGKNMWYTHSSSLLPNRTIYKSNWWWPL